MSWGKVNQQWNHTASFMAILAAINSDPSKGSPPSPADFHPFVDPPPLPQASPEFLASLFASRKGAANG